MNHNHTNHHHTTHFQTRKTNCLSKRDKSSAGRIDPRAVDICAALNSRDEYYTTSSCAGRCFLYCGDGIKSWHSSGGGGEDGSGVVDGSSGGGSGGAGGGGKLGFFQRYRVNHDLIREPQRYFNLTTLIEGGGDNSKQHHYDPTGGGDPIPTIGQFDQGNNANFKNKLEEGRRGPNKNNNNKLEEPIWLRFEPFILHVMCRSLEAASVLMALARPSFKNVGLTSWNNGGGGGGLDEYNNTAAAAAASTEDKNQQMKGGGPRFLVAIWGDEGLDMPLSLPSSPGRGLYYHPPTPTDDDKNTTTTTSANNNNANADWLAQLVNERHARN
ncbi:hypothetical protein ACHAXR_001190, partial [Thalassiosira sp. AJA248-18]